MLKLITEEAYDPEQHSPAHDKSYEQHTQELVKLTGFEHITNLQGELIPRNERKQNFEKALTMLNKDLCLGMGAFDLKVMTLLYTALSEVPRYQGDIHIYPVKGENTGTHSIHSILRGNKMIDAAEVEESWEVAAIRQKLCLTLMVHDFGELLGEPACLAVAWGNSTKKDKVESERKIKNYGLRWAAQAVFHNDDSLLFDKIQKVKEQVAVNDQAEQDEDLLEKLDGVLGNISELNSQLEERMAFYANLWEVAETKGKTATAIGNNTEFIGLLAAFSEHAQGTGHLLRFVDNGEERTEPHTLPLAFTNSDRMVGGEYYIESEIGDLFDKAQTDSERKIAKATRDESYRLAIEHLEIGPKVVDRKHTPGKEPKAQDPEREGSVEKLLEAHAEERKRYTKQNPDDSRAKNVVFDAETKERLIEMYQWAIENDFTPEPGQILIVDPPQAYLERGGDRSCHQTHSR